MRAVTESAGVNFFSGNQFHRDNTRVDNAPGWDSVLYLHGNAIARRRGRVLQVTLAGWNTSTTRERLQAAGVRVHTKAGQAYLNDKAWSGDWVTVHADGTWASEVRRAADAVRGHNS
jgi:hypothetical protein